MAHLYASVMVPPKLELVTAWVRRQAWADGDLEGPLERVGAFRWDDPAGEVGVEVLLFTTADGVLLHVPATYRDAPLEGADEHLMGTTEHSVLGRRWAYDGCADPVWAVATLRAALTGAHQAEERLEAADGTVTVREPAVRAHGTGTSGAAGDADALPDVVDAADLTVRLEEGVTVVEVAGHRLDVPRVLDRTPPVGTAASRPEGTEAVLATWAGQESPVALVVASRP